MEKILEIFYTKVPILQILGNYSTFYILHLVAEVSSLHKYLPFLFRLAWLKPINGCVCSPWQHLDQNECLVLVLQSSDELHSRTNFQTFSNILWFWRETFQIACFLLFSNDRCILVWFMHNIFGNWMKGKPNALNEGEQEVMTSFLLRNIYD